MLADIESWGWFVRQLRGVSFNDSEADMLRWAEKQGTFSRYVKKLIHRDIRTEKEGVDPRMAELIAQMLDSRLAGKLAAATNINAPGEGAEVDPSLLMGVFS